MGVVDFTFVLYAYLSFFWGNEEFVADLKGDEPGSWEGVSTLPLGSGAQEH